LFMAMVDQVHCSLKLSKDWFNISHLFSWISLVWQEAVDPKILIIQILLLKKLLNILMVTWKAGE